MSIISLPITLGRGKRKLRVLQSNPTQIDNDSGVGVLTLSHRKNNEVGIARVIDDRSYADTRRIDRLQEYMVNKAHDIIYNP
jgi:hypothetical protein